MQRLCSRELAINLGGRVEKQKTEASYAGLVDRFLTVV